jgi:antitoxin ParD1/3/4
MLNPYRSAHTFMSLIDKRTISLPREQSSYIDGLVGSGKYSSASEVVRAGLRAVRERDAAIGQWLKNEVALTYDAMEANPSRGVGLDEVLKNLQRHHSRKTRQRSLLSWIILHNAALYPG